MAKDKIENLADTIINLTPQEAQKLQVVIKAKMMPEIERQKALLDEQGNNPQVQQMGQPQQQNMAPPNVRDVAVNGLLR
jgi:ketol-acid reductoisomerase